MLDSTSDRLRVNIDKIMARWEARAMQEVLAAKELKSLALRDELPKFLIQIVNALSTEINRTAARVQVDRYTSMRVSQTHGDDRAGNSNYTIEQLISEYHILRQVICDVMEEENTPLSPVERETIVCAIEQAVSDAAARFSIVHRKSDETLAAAVMEDLRIPIGLVKMNTMLLLRRPGDVNHCIKIAGRIVIQIDRLNSIIDGLINSGTQKKKESPLQL